MTDSQGGTWEPEPFCEDVSGGSPPVVRTPYFPEPFCEDVSGGPENLRQASAQLPPRQYTRHQTVHQTDRTPDAGKTRAKHGQNVGKT